MSCGKKSFVYKKKNSFKKKPSTTNIFLLFMIQYIQHHVFVLKLEKIPKSTAHLKDINNYIPQNGLLLPK